MLIKKSVQIMDAGAVPVISPEAASGKEETLCISALKVVVADSEGRDTV